MKVWQKCSQQADGRQIGTNFINEADAGQVSKLAEKGGSETANSERQSEEEAGDHANFSWKQFLGIDQNRREC